MHPNVHIDHRNLTFPVWMEARASTSLLFSSALLQTWRPQLPALLDVRSQHVFSVSNESHIDVRGLVLACGPIGRRDLCQRCVCSYMEGSLPGGLNAPSHFEVSVAGVERIWMGFVWRPRGAIPHT